MLFVLVKTLFISTGHVCSTKLSLKCALLWICPGSKIAACCYSLVDLHEMCFFFYPLVDAGQLEGIQHFLRTGLRSF